MSITGISTPTGSEQSSSLLTTGNYVGTDSLYHLADLSLKDLQPAEPSSLFQQLAEGLFNVQESSLPENKGKGTPWQTADKTGKDKNVNVLPSGNFWYIPSESEERLLPTNSETKEVIDEHDSIRPVTSKLQARGLDGTGVTVIVIDEPRDFHAEAVHSVVRAMAPDAKMVIFGFDAEDVEAIGSGDTGLPIEPTSTAEIVDDLTEVFQDSTQMFKDILRLTKEDSSKKAINMSYGVTETNMTIGVYMNLMARNMTGEYVSPQFRQEILGDNTKAEELNDKAILKRAHNFVTGVLLQDPKVVEARQAWTNITRQAKEDAGIFVTVAAGNSGREAKMVSAATEGTVRPDTKNLLDTDYTLAVEASNNNGTPENLSDDRLADFSSRGDRIAAPGVSVETISPAGSLNRINAYNGTSFAAPYTQGLAANMFEADPNLTPDELEALMRQTTVTGHDSSRILDPLAAVSAALVAAGKPPLSAHVLPNTDESFSDGDQAPLPKQQP